MPDNPNSIPPWRDRALELRARGLSRIAIGRILKVNPETVQYWLMPEDWRDQRREKAKRRHSGEFTPHQPKQHVGMFPELAHLRGWQEARATALALAIASRGRLDIAAYAKETGRTRSYVYETARYLRAGFPDQFVADDGFYVLIRPFRSASA